MKTRLSLVAATVLTLVGAAAPALGAVAPNADTTPAPLQYVALGDSYSAGSGNLPFSPGVVPYCAQSTKNFSHDIAAATGAHLTDVSCGGAETKDFTTSQYPGLAPQLDAVSASTQLITMTIGGNDADTLAIAAGSCGVSSVLTLGLGAPCKTVFGSTFDNLVQNTVYPNVKAALLAVRAKAPNARVVVVGYPWIMPATRGCWPSLPIAAGDIPYLRSLQAHLNGVIEQAADETGATFVDMSVLSNGHDSCQKPVNRWVEPILGARGFTLIHPNQTGEAEMAKAVMTAIGLS
ncbi:MAG TPA: SGNH/GDSL hydrolase family protein [Marmoricola sp.]|jgi:lysophospholipase L1-like esterase|nr:SGNH/GDSL hydrolase family protein [Marmoricola sp.]